MLQRILDWDSTLGETVIHKQTASFYDPRWAGAQYTQQTFATSYFFILKRLLQEWDAKEKCGKFFHIEAKTPLIAGAIGRFFNENMEHFNHPYSGSHLVQRSLRNHFTSIDKSLQCFKTLSGEPTPDKRPGLGKMTLSTAGSHQPLISCKL